MGTELFDILKGGDHIALSVGRVRATDLKKKNNGKQSEEMIDKVNEIYNKSGVALIQGIPEPTRITGKSKSGKHEMAHYKESTVDYFGITDGIAFAFDVKSTVASTRFDLKNIGEHQLAYLMNFEDQKGRGFFLVHFIAHKEWYFAPVKVVWDYWLKANYQKGKKNIPYDDFKNGRLLIKIPKGKVGVDYRKLIKHPT